MIKMGERQSKYNENIRKLRKLSREYLIKLLDIGTLNSKEIIDEIKLKFPEYCDDKIICTCRQGGSYKEWKHQIQWAIQDLKHNKKIEYNKKIRKYSIKK